jgi:hypothetical protein
LILLDASWAVSPGEFFFIGHAAHCALPDIAKFRGRMASACVHATLGSLDSMPFGALQQDLLQRTK